MGYGRTWQARGGREGGAASAEVEWLWPIVVAVVRRVLGGADPDEEDVVQTVLERLLASDVADVPEDRRAQWAAAVARNVAIDALRARARTRRVLVLDGDVAADRAFDLDPERLALARERLLRYLSAVAGLHAGHAQVVYMHEVLGHELSEIAQVLGISVAAAQSRLVRGRRHIASRLKIHLAPTRAPAADRSRTAPSFEASSFTVFRNIG